MRTTIRTMRKTGGALIVALMLTGCSAPSNTDGDYTITDTIDGQDVRLDLPGQRDPVGVAIWFHGQGGDAATRMNEEWLNALRVDGWAVASSDFYGNHWGSEDAVELTRELGEWAEGEAGADVKLYVAGSMGGLVSLNAMTQGENPGCWYGTMPVLDQRTTENVPDAAGQIEESWPDGVDTDFIPAENLDRLPPAKYRVLSSPGDTWVPEDENAKLLETAGLDVSVRTVQGEHGNPSHFSIPDLEEFAASCV